MMTQSRPSKFVVFAKVKVSHMFSAFHGACDWEGSWAQGGVLK